MGICDQHSGVVAKLEQLDRQVSDLFSKYNDHCNGNGRHVYRPEHDRLEGERDREVSAVTDSVRRLVQDVDARLKATEERQAASEQERAVQAAGLSRTDKVLVAVLMALSPLATAAIALLKP